MKSKYFLTIFSVFITLYSISADRFWVGGTGNWSDINHWSTTSNGTPGATSPTLSDNAIFDVNSGLLSPANVVTLDIPVSVLNFDFSAVANSFTLASGLASIEIRGSLLSNGLADILFAGDIVMLSSTPGSFLKSNGQIWNNNFVIDGVTNADGVTLLDEFVTLKNIINTSGKFISAGFDITCSNFSSTLIGARTINFATSTVTLTGNNWTLDNGTLPLPLTWTAPDSIIFTNPTENHFSGGDKIYNVVNSLGDTLIVNGSNTFTNVTLPTSSYLELDNSSSNVFTNLFINGTCTAPFTIGTTNNALLPATIEINGSAIWNAQGLEITNTNTTGPTVYNVAISTLTNSIGWTPSGAIFYWIDDSGNWNDVSHWSNSSGGPISGCIPTVLDFVFFDNASFSSANQTVLVNDTAYFKSMDWTGITTSQNLALDSNVVAHGDIVLNSNLNLFRNVVGSGIQIERDAQITINSATVDCNFLVSTNAVGDTVELMDDLIMSDSSSILLFNGNFITNNNYLETGSIISINNPTTASDGRGINFGTSLIHLSQKFSSKGDTSLVFSGASSEIFIGDTVGYGNDLLTEGLTFNKVTLDFEPLNIGTFVLQQKITGSNTFNRLEIKPGSHVFFDSSGTQSIVDSLIIRGNCKDSINIYSTDTISTINQANLSTLATTDVLSECLNFKGINASGTSFTTLFSTDEGSNTNITFSSTPAVTANYTANGPYCFGDTTLFTNTSTAISGNTSDITSVWYFNDGTTGYYANPPTDSTWITYVADTNAHVFSGGGTFNVTLISTYTNFCADTSTQAITIYRPELFLNTDDIDKSICAGDSVTFEAGSSLLNVTFEYFLNGISLNTPSVNDTLYVTTNLNDNDSISVIGYQGGCPSDSVPHFIFNVNPLPTFTWTSSDADTSICSGTLVTFDANSADPTDLYRYRLNNSNVTGFTLPGIYSTSSLIDNDVVSLVAKTTFGCLDTLSMVFNVDPLPSTTLSASTVGSIICQNESITYTALGADTYEFFINNVSQQGPSATNTWTTNSLTATDTVSVVGYNTIGGCALKAPQTFNYTVLPLPSVSLTDSDADNIVCSIDNITFTASGAGQYTYYVNGAIAFGPTTSTTYTTTLSNNDAVHVVGSFGGCTNSTVPTVFTVNTSPTTSLSSSDADNSICLNSSVLFTAFGATTYEFFVNGASQGAPSASPTFTTTSLTNGQTVLVNGVSNGCTVSSQLTFAVLPLPSINLFSNDPDNTICQGDPITLTGANGTNYQLFVNGIAQGGVQVSPTFVNPTLASGANNVYVIGTGVNGCQASSSTLTITQNLVPTMALTSSDADNVICAGQSITFTGSGSTSYQFLVNGVPQGSFTTVPTFTTSGITNGQSVTVNGTTLGCTSTSAPIVTVVNSIPSTVLSNDDGNNVFCTNQLVTFTAAGATNYEFFVNGVSQGSSSAVNTINSTSFGTGPISVMVVGNSNNCTSSATNNVTVNPLPTANLTSSDIDNLICSGTSVTYTANGGNQYQFYLNSNPLGSLGTTNTYSSSSFNNGDVISVDVVSAAGCLSSTSHSALTVNTTPTVLISSSDADQVICLNDNVVFNFSGASSYEYFIDGVSQGLPSATSTFSTSTLTNGADIFVTGSSNGCFDNSPLLTFTVYGPPAITLINNGENVVCTNEAVDLSAMGGINYQYLVNGNPVTGFTSNSNYNGTVNNGDVVTVIGEANGCTMLSAQSITYTVNTYPSISTSSSDLDNTICLNEAVTFNASNASTYEFSVNGNIQQSGATNSYATSGLENGAIVSIVGYNGDCASTPSTYTFTVNSMNLDLSVSPSSLICEGTNVVFTATGADQYEFFLNGNSQGAMSTTSTYNSSTLSDNDQVTFTGYSTTTLCTQVLNDYIQLNTIAEPTIVASAGPNFCEGDSIVLTSNQSYGNQWYLNGNPIVGATDTNLVVYSFGDYSLETTLGGSGQVWSFGWNATGAFGDGSNLNNANPTQANSSTLFDELSSGSNYILGVTTSNEVYSWGENSSGQLGNGTYTSSNVPQLVPTLTNIKTIATSESSSMAVSNTGQTYVWGNNTLGQLGTGSTSVINFPFANPSLTNVDSIAAGRSHFIVLKNDGTVWSTGDNSFGQLGLGTLVNSTTPQQVSGLSNIVSVGAGEYHSFAISNSGDLYVWGNNGSGQLGLNDLNGRLIPTLSELKNITNAQGGANHSVFLSSANKVYTTGGNQFGQLGTADLIDRMNPTEISISGAALISAGQYTSLVLRNDHSVFGFGNNTEEQLSSTNGVAISTPEFISDLDGVTFIEASNFASHFIYGQSTSCVSSTLNLTMVPVSNVTISAVGNILSTITGTAYQWYFNGNIIPGENNQTITATTPGFYSVEVTFGGNCTGMSDEYPYNVIGLEELSQDLTIYPNPTNGIVHIELTNELLDKATGIYLMDMSGRKVQLDFENSATILDIDLTNFASGVYLLELHSSNGVISRSQLVKTN